MLQVLDSDRSGGLTADEFKAAMKKLVSFGGLAEFTQQHSLRRLRLLGLCGSSNIVSAKHDMSIGCVDMRRFHDTTSFMFYLTVQHPCRRRFTVLLLRDEYIERKRGTT